jgi:hypothetical protein
LAKEAYTLAKEAYKHTWDTCPSEISCPRASRRISKPAHVLSEHGKAKKVRSLTGETVVVGVTFPLQKPLGTTDPSS